MAYDRRMNEFFKGMADGTYTVDDHVNKVNPASLFAYHSTLPALMRNSQIVTNVLYALEFHQPRYDARDKELALNYAASFLRPIDERLLDVIKIMASAKRPRLDMALGKEMMNEQRFWPFDPLDVGDEDNEEEGGAGDEDITTLLAGVAGEDGEVESMADRMLAKIRDPGVRLEKEREALLTKDLNISRFQVEPEVE